MTDKHESTPRVLDSRVWSKLPYPVAAAWRSAVLAGNAQTQRSHLLAAHETLLRTLLAILLADYVTGTRSEVLEREIGRHGRLSAGELARLVEELSAHLSTRKGSEPFLRELGPWLRRELGTKRQGSGSPIRMWRDISRIRNRRAHHDAPPDSESAAHEEVDELQARLRLLLDSLRWLEGYRLIHVARAGPSERSENGFRGRVQVYMGREALPEAIPAEWEATPRLLGNRVYLLDPSGEAALDLDPLMRVLPDPKHQQPRLFLLKEIGRQGEVRLRHGADDAQRWETPRHKGSSVPFRKWLASTGERYRFHDLLGTLRPTETPETAPAGELLDGRYEVIERVGVGGMGEVLRVLDREFDQERAVKLLRADAFEDAVLRERFLREAETAMGLRHPHILPVFDRGQLEDGRLYLTMPLVTGGSLVDRREPGGLPWERVAAWARAALDALGYLHDVAHVVHRDIKPSNILFDERGALLIADFGVARRVEDGHLTATLESLGTPAYAAPEQKPGVEVDGRADVYALAVVTHELLTGALPTSDPGEGVAGPAGEWLRRLGARQVEERPTAAEALAALPGVGESRTTFGEGAGESVSAGLGAGLGKRWSVAFIAAGALALGVVVAVAFGWTQAGAPSGPVALSTSEAPPDTSTVAVAAGGGPATLAPPTRAKQTWVTDAVTRAPCAQGGVCASDTMKCLDGLCVPEGQVAEARERLLAHMENFERGDYARFLTDYADPLDCFYDKALDCQRRWVPKGVGNSFSEASAAAVRAGDKTRSYKFTEDALTLLYEKPDEVAFWAPNGTVSYEGVTHPRLWQVFVLKRVGRSWFITTEVGCTQHKCWEEAFDRYVVRIGGRHDYKCFVR